MARRRGRVMGALAILALLGGIVLAAPTAWAHAQAAGRLRTVDDVPAEPVAVVLGASVNPDRTPSPYLEARLRVALELFRAGKVRAILVSGDNRESHYDEPTAMRTWLIAHGVPERKVVADFAGLDTYDTCYRARDIFGAQRVIMVSQEYHLYRAVATCRALGLDAYGVGDNSAESRGSTAWRNGAIREVFAGIKMVWDLASGRRPTLGPRETSLDDALRD